MTDQKLSVIMGVYNAEATLAAAIESILTQTHSNFNLIICDDASTDASRQIALDYAKADSRVQVVGRDQNEGLANALNHCLSLCGDTDIIARQDADDISQPNRLEQSLRFLQSSGADFIGTSANLFDEDGTYGVRSYPQSPNVKTLAKYNPFIHPTMIFQAGILQAVQGYRDFYRCEDYDLVMRLFARGYKGQNLSTPLLNYYEHRTNGKAHTLKSRLAEFKVRAKGLKAMRAPFYLYIYCLKPLLLLLVPKFLYRKLRPKRQSSPSNQP